MSEWTSQGHLFCELDALDENLQRFSFLILIARFVTFNDPAGLFG
jgi:hypothetical protein